VKNVLCILILAVATRLASAGVTKVVFDDAGNTLVNGKPFFPIGLFTYSLDSKVMEEAHKLHFNTLIMLTEHHKPDQLDWVRKESFMALCPSGEGWVRAGSNHPAVLAWYLSDEPEGHSISPALLREQYLALKARDPNHPIGLDHFLWEALANYKDACDFTMTSTYPIGTMPITHVGLFIDRARSQHAANWPHWPYIQIFGGPDTDGGKWKQPEPGEVRCMVYDALVHRANGIFYFSYWPKAPKTWSAVGVLNDELRRLAPWLLAHGKENEARSNLPQVQVRAKAGHDGKSGVVLLVNTSPDPCTAEMTIPQLPAKSLRPLFDGHTFKPVKGAFTEKLSGYDTRAYVWGKAN
jgi:hypothetical protein